MPIDLEQPVADLVTAHPALASILQRHRIDFCCRGDRSLRAWCADRKIDEVELTRALELAIATRADTVLDPSKLPTPLLVQHIVTRHHAYLREALPFLVPLAAKVARVHGDLDLRLHEVRTIVEDLDEALRPHLDREERGIFAAIARAEEVSRADLDQMRAEHREVGELLESLRDATHEYVVPAGACRSWTTLLAELETLERDVLIHVHLENHVLAPRLEQEARADVAVPRRVRGGRRVVS